MNFVFDRDTPEQAARRNWCDLRRETYDPPPWLAQIFREAHAKQRTPADRRIPLSAWLHDLDPTAGWSVIHPRAPRPVAGRGGEIHVCRKCQKHSFIAEGKRRQCAHCNRRRQARHRYRHSNTG